MFFDITGESTLGEKPVWKEVGDDQTRPARGKYDLMRFLFSWSFLIA